MHSHPLAAAFESVEIAAPVIFENLTMIPLLAPVPHGSALDYVVLDDALAERAVEITEVSEEGSVPDLKVINRGPRPVLIVDGEELLGAKQNRVVNLTILVPAHAELTIPVSCVEAGRWRARSRSFTAAPRTQYASGRAKRMAHVSLSIALRGDRVSDQVDVWNDIAEKSSRLNAASPTAAMESIFTTHEGSLESFVEALRPVDNQIGAVFAIGSRVVGFDLFDRPSTLNRLLPKLIRSAAIEAIDDVQSTDSAAVSVPVDPRAHAAQFLALASSAAQHRTPAVGLGEDLRLTAPHVAGAALLLSDQVVHIGAFAV